MKKITVFFSFSLLLLTGYCLSAAVMKSESGTFPAQKVQGAQGKKKTAASSNKPSAAELEAGKQLIAQSDCGGCHKVDTKLLGPSYVEIAKKYAATEANYMLLSDKIIKGGSGNWGQIPMSPHTTLSVADAKKMAKYVLSLKQ